MPALLAALFAYIIWGAAPPIFKYALSGGIPPFTLAFIRFFGAGLLLLPFALRYQSKLTLRELVFIIAGGFTGITINVGAFFIGLEYAPSINVNVIGALGPIMLYILSLIILKERAHPQILKGMLISLVGAGIIVLTPLVGGDTTTDVMAESIPGYLVLVGNALFILATLGGVLHMIIIKKISRTVHPLFHVCLSFFAGSFFFIPPMMAELPTWNIAQLDGKGIIGIVYGIFLCSALAYYLQMYALTKLNVQEIGIFSYVAPVVAVLIAIPLLGEMPDIYFIFGTIGIFAGVIISERHPHFRTMRKKLHPGK